jgi:UDP-N-acetylmuramoyl-tripeptide--D-alanyl-D-alanine ligase
VNNVMPAHIQGFGSIDGVAKAKGEIYQALSSQNIAVVNIDDRYSDTWLATLPSKVIRVSLNNQNADCYASSIEYATEFVQFELHIRSEVKSISLQALGEHNVRNALMAAAMAFSVGASLEKIRDGLALFSPVSGRMTSRVGIKGAKIIDDSYNANPGSVRAAIDVLASRDGHRILVLGDLGELGPEAEQQHFDLGIYAQNKKIEGVFTLGNLSRHASLAFASATSAHYESRDLLIETLKDIANPNTTFLIKGSRSAKMELVVNALCSAQETSTGDSH